MEGRARALDSVTTELRVERMILECRLLQRPSVDGLAREPGRKTEAWGLDTARLLETCL